MKASDKKSLKTTLFCFTPLVSLATFAIELILAIYVLFKYPTKAGRLSALFLFILGFFQLIEYGICKTDHDLWLARIGFAAIVFLPPLGLHLLTVTLKDCYSLKKTVIFSYIVATLLALPLLLFTNIMLSATCAENYVIFDFHHIYEILYFTFYYIVTAIVIVFLFRSYIICRKDRKISGWALTAVLTSSIPVIILVIIEPRIWQAHASIFCGLALVIALVLVWKLIPIYHQSRRK